MKTYLRLCGLLLLTAPMSYGQVSVTTSTYSQNFDALAVSGSGVPWNDNSTIVGWYSKRYNVANPSGSVSQFTPSNIINGTQFPYEISAYGGSGDMALGSGLNGESTLGTTVSSAFGVRLVNNFGSLSTSFSISYTGEQWSRSSNLTQVTDKLAFSYQIFNSGTGSLVDTGWTSVASVDFTSPNASLTTSSELNGNLAGNQAAISGLVSGVSLAEGQELWLRWLAADTININDHHLAIDNLTVSFGTIPEPATYGLVFAGLAATVAVFRRRKRK